MHTTPFKLYTFDDADDAAAAMQTGDVQFALRKRPIGEFRVMELKLPGRARLVVARFGAAFSATAVSYPGFVTLSWPTERRPGHGWTVNGRAVGSDSIVTIQGGTEHVAHTEGPVGWATLHVPVDLWPKRATPALSVTHLPRFAGLALHAWTRGVVRQATAARAPITPYRWQDVLHDLVFPHLDRTAGPRTPNARPRKGALARLNSFLLMHPSDVVYAEDLERVLNLSARGVRQLFQDNFGMSAAQYLRLRRLNNAHRDLKRGPWGRKPVTEVAYKHGFFDLGRFASAYRDIFGELPSETARRGLDDSVAGS
jgi:AraC-like DNA-binding protein